MTMTIANIGSSQMRTLQREQIQMGTQKEQTATEVTDSFQASNVKNTIEGQDSFAVTPQKIGEGSFLDIVSLGLSETMKVEFPENRSDLEVYRKLNNSVGAVGEEYKKVQKSSDELRGSLIGLMDIDRADLLQEVNDKGTAVLQAKGWDPEQVTYEVAALYYAPYTVEVADREISKMAPGKTAEEIENMAKNDPALAALVTLKKNGSAMIKQGQKAHEATAHFRNELQALSLDKNGQDFVAEVEQDGKDILTLLGRDPEHVSPESTDYAKAMATSLLLSQKVDNPPVAQPVDPAFDTASEGMLLAQH